MSESPAPPKPPNPVEAAKHAHKGIKGKLGGHPKWVYIAGGVVLIGVAFLVWQRNRANAEGGTVAGDATASPSPGDTGYYPDATQGAFGGYSDPGFLDPVGQTPEPSGTPTTTAPVNIYVGQPAPTSEDAVAEPELVPAMPTGGGTVVARAPAVVHAPPPPAPANSWVGQWTAAAQATQTGPFSPYPADTPPPGFPNKGPDGWFRREYDAHRKRHYHLYQDGHKVWL